MSPLSPSLKKHPTPTDFDSPLRCDADPAALAKYVLALIKKDKSVDELKESMVSQMDVFLQNETKSFVEMLFTVVDTKEYINPPAVKVCWG